MLLNLLFTGNFDISKLFLRIFFIIISKGFVFFWSYHLYLICILQQMLKWSWPTWPSLPLLFRSMFTCRCIPILSKFWNHDGKAFVLWYLFYHWGFDPWWCNWIPWGANASIYSPVSFFPYSPSNCKHGLRFCPAPIQVWDQYPNKKGRSPFTQHRLRRIEPSQSSLDRHGSTTPRRDCHGLEWTKSHKNATKK